ncbi:hypothetical protein E1B28_012929 [Marasmius oreades]|uniref:Extracellular metalloproteinase n=1 Tax=Marasmius oreades TaxID=181124 RepID=A0A9P7UP81_9AGAR|nr:uncharacterized protein E1B28_012929 [Marasmius oreades]KAG7088983.1 hypothetical protein E1B28_012929 [Marasmius oreades]
MGFQTSLCIFVLAGVLYASLSEAVPPPVLASKHATHRKHLIGSGVSLESYHPQPQFQTFGEGKLMANALSFEDTESLKSNVMGWLTDNLQVNSSSLEWTSGWSSEGRSCGYVQQVHDGVPFINAVANVAFNGNKVISFGNSFVDTSNIASPIPTVSLNDAILEAESTLGGTHNGIQPTLRYLARPDGSVALVHAIQVQSSTPYIFVVAYVDAHSGKVISINDFVADATFRVLPIEKKTISDGLELLKNPEGLDASPVGWNSIGKNHVLTTDTVGNNVIAIKVLSNDGSTTKTTAGQINDGQLTFDFTYDPTKDPTDPGNDDAARTNAFYVANEFHDILYRYGFTENTFNFQSDNFGKGGQANDPVQMSVQDPSGFNNANFAAPPDGQAGICRLFIFDLTNIRQDSVMENGIPIHELTHGVTLRMTGGGTAVCLPSLESGGMGEGWSDAVADWMSQTSSKTQDFVTGESVTGKPGGFRSKPYSTDEAVNPLRYSDIKKLDEPHAIGEVWANTLHTVYADLVDALGFSTTAKTDANGKEGNIVFMKTIITALTIQPCNPTVLNARDAIIQADKTLNAGANECTLRKSFAKKGLGLRATSDFQDDFTFPSGC